MLALTQKKCFRGVQKGRVQKDRRRQQSFRLLFTDSRGSGIAPFHRRIENRNQLHFNDTIPVLAHEHVPPYTHANTYVLSSPCCFIISDSSVSSR